MRLKRFLLSIGLLISVIVTPIPNANALTVKVAPAGWTYLFTGYTPANKTSIPRVLSVNLEKKSNFVPIYNNVPDVAKASIQRAIDIWSENFSSKVPVNVNVAWTKAPNSTIYSCQELITTLQPESEDFCSQQLLMHMFNFQMADV